VPVSQAKLQVQKAVEQNNKQAQKALEDAKKKNAAEIKKVRFVCVPPF
jgi:mannitol-specific phosphotransferase system IIBC component